MEQNRSKTTKLKLGRTRGAGLIFGAVDGCARKAVLCSTRRPRQSSGYNKWRHSGAVDDNIVVYRRLCSQGCAL